MCRLVSMIRVSALRDSFRGLVHPCASAQCTNIAGNWNATETGTITLVLNASDGESDTETNPVSGSGIVTITQTGTCTFQYTPIGLTGSSLINSGLTPSQLASLVRTVTVSGDNVTETGVFAVINTAADAQGLTITGTTGNVYTGTGQVSTANPPVMTLNGSGNLVISGTYEGYTFTLTYTASSTAVFTKENPIAITPPARPPLEVAWRITACSPQQEEAGPDMPGVSYLDRPGRPVFHLVSQRPHCLPAFR
jgi:hypothetical protein